MARSKDSKQISVERRKFLKNGVLTGAAAWWHRRQSLARSLRAHRTRPGRRPHLS
jgi:hypothetical protein